MAIGRAIAKAYCTAGAKVVMVALHEDKLDEAEREMRFIGASVSKLCGDVAEPDTSQRAVEAALADWGSN